MTLIDKLSALTGPDFNVDKEIYKALFADEYATRVEKLKSGPMGHRLTIYDYDGYIAVPAYTASIDAAMTLVPEGWWLAGLCFQHVDFRSANDCAWSAELGGSIKWVTYDGYPEPEFPIANGQAATPAIALCIASLKARGVE